MVTAANRKLFTVEESDMDGVFYVAYDGKQIAPFASEEDTHLYKGLFLMDLDQDIVRLAPTYEYTHKIDPCARVNKFDVIHVGGQGYVFAYTNKNQVCDLFQFDVNDFKIYEKDLDLRCETLQEGLSFCVETQKRWLFESSHPNYRFVL